MDFLKDRVTDKRTGASISPIQVETQGRYILNPMNANMVAVPKADKIPEARSMLLDTIEKLGKEAEELHIQNERAKVDIELDKLDVEFKEKWAQVHDKYSDEKYPEYLKDYENFRKRGEKIIATSNYYADEEKFLMSEKYKVRGQSIRADIQKERTAHYVQKEIQTAEALNKQRISIIGTYGLYEEKRRNEGFRQIAETEKRIGALMGRSPQLTSEIIANKIGEANGLIVNNHLANINSSNKTTAQKKAEINAVYEYFKRDEVIDALADELVETINPVDRETAKEDLKIGLSGYSIRAVKEAQRQINAIEKQERAYARQLAQIEKANKNSLLQLRSDIVNSSNYEMAEKYVYKDTKGFTYNDRIMAEKQAKETGNFMNTPFFNIVGKTTTEVVANEEYVVGFVPSKEKQRIGVDIENEILINGKSGTEALFLVANNYARGDGDIANLIVNDLTQDGGYTKAIDIGIKANKGYAKEGREFEHVKAIENTMKYSPNLSENEVLAFMNNNPYIQDVANEIIKKGAPEERAKVLATRLYIGSMAMKEKVPIENIDNSIIYRDFNKDTITKTKQSINKLIKDDDFLEASKALSSPRGRLKPANLEGNGLKK